MVATTKRSESVNKERYVIYRLEYDIRSTYFSYIVIMLLDLRDKIKVYSCIK